MLLCYIANPKDNSGAVIKFCYNVHAEFVRQRCRWPCRYFYSLWVDSEAIYYNFEFMRVNHERFTDLFYTEKFQLSSIDMYLTY